MTRIITQEIPERWRDIPGYNGKYQISNMGRVRRFDRAGKVHMMAVNEGRSLVQVTLYDSVARKSHTYTVHRLMVAAWMASPPPPGMCISHKNGMITDNRLENLVYRTMARINGLKRSNRRTVAKVDAKGRVIEHYTSLRAAGDANGVCGNTIRYYCMRRNKRAFDDAGCTFRYDDDDRRLGQ